MASYQTGAITSEGQNNAPDPSVETPSSPLILDATSNSIKPSVYKINMQPIFEPTTSAKIANNNKPYIGPNSVPPPSGPPPSFPTMQNDKSPSSLPKYHLDNNIHPPNGVPPSIGTNIELQPTISSLAPPNIGAKLQAPSHKHNDNQSADNSIVWMESIRTATSILDHVDPTKGLWLLFTIAIIIILCCLAMTSAIEHYILDIRIDLASEGTYVWSFGWWGNKFWFMHDNECSACLFGDETIEDIQKFKIPLPNTLIYAKNAGYLFIATIGIILFWIVCIIFVLCERRNAGEILYLNICKLQLPQRPFVFFAFDTIHMVTWLCIIYYSMLIIYGYIEAHFYMENICGADAECIIYVIPHYGYCALFAITFPIVFCALSKTKDLDDKLTDKTYSSYFPKNAEKMEAEPGSISSAAVSKSYIVMKYLCSAVTATRMICILSFVIWVSFKDVGLISVSYAKDTISKNTFSRYFQGIGLRNTHKIFDLSAFSESNSDTFASGTEFGFTTFMTTWESNNFISDTDLFSLIAFYWNWWVCGIIVINMLFVASYIIFVVEKYKSNKCMKVIIIWVTIIELIGHVGFMGMYYYQFFSLFSQSQSDLESILSDMTGSEFNVSWYPDWGLLISILLCFYLIKLMRAISKAT